MKTTRAFFLIIITVSVSCYIGCSESEDAGKTSQGTEPIKTEMGTPIGEMSSGTIGSGGGVLESSDGRLSVIIPEGALESNALVSIQPLTNQGPLGVGSGYRLKPEGITFSKPVLLEFHYDDDLLGETPEEFLWIITQAEDLSWNAMLKSVVDPALEKVTVEVSHFSDWALARFIDLSLNPHAVTLLKGKSVDLRVAGFMRDQSTRDDDLAPLIPITGSGEGLTPLTPIPPVESRFMSFKVKKWTLNGTAAPVSNSNGSLSGSGTTAKYTAPNKKPDSNPVAVTVELEASNKEGRKSSFMLTSTISIVDSDYYLLVDIDGTIYEYYQYGFNGTIPPDPNDISLANCGYSDADGLSVGGVHSVNNTDLKDSFLFVLSEPAEGSKSLECYLDEGTDDVAFLQGAMKPQYSLTVTTRTMKNGACEHEISCSPFSVTLLEYTGANLSEVTGDFSGVLHEDNEDNWPNCKSSVPHTVKGHFRLVLVK